MTPVLILLAILAVLAVAMLLELQEANPVYECDTCKGLYTLENMHGSACHKCAEGTWGETGLLSPERPQEALGEFGLSHRPSGGLERLRGEMRGEQ